MIIHKDNVLNYYTPTIDEFHVGFKYEVLAESDNKLANVMTTFPIEKENWLKFTHPDPYTGYMLPRLFSTCKLRVKYLNKEDLESLGFVHEKIGWYKHDSPSGELGYWTMVSLRTWHDNTMIIRGHRGNSLDSTEQEILFDGTIKNISELTKLLKQLRIL